MRKIWLATTAALIATPLLGLPAWAASCVTDTVADYEALGATGCTVGGLTFFDISVSAITSGTGTVALGNITPFTLGPESGLSLNYSANTGTTSGSQADVAWTYDVIGSGITDAFVALSGSTTGDGTIGVNEVLNNLSTGAPVTTLNLYAAGSTTATFGAVPGLGVIKDQNDFSGSSGSATTSVVQNGFSFATTPIPGTFPLLATGLVALWALRRKPSKGRLDSALG